MENHAEDASYQDGEMWIEEKVSRLSPWMEVYRLEHLRRGNPQWRRLIKGLDHVVHGRYYFLKQEDQNEEQVFWEWHRPSCSGGSAPCLCHMGLWSTWNLVSVNWFLLIFDDFHWRSCVWPGAIILDCAGLWCTTIGGSELEAVGAAWGDCSLQILGCEKCKERGKDPEVNAGYLPLLF